MMKSIFLLKDPTTADAAWKSTPLPDATPGRRRNVSRLRVMGGDTTCAPPDFNSDNSLSTSQEREEPY